MKIAGKTIKKVEKITSDRGAEFPMEGYVLEFTDGTKHVFTYVVGKADTVHSIPGDNFDFTHTISFVVDE